MAAALKMSNSAPVDLALEDVLDGVFSSLVLLAGLDLWDLAFLVLVGWTKRKTGNNFHFELALNRQTRKVLCSLLNI